MQHNGNFKQWFNVFLVPSEAWQGYKLKAYGVSNHHLKLQSKKFSRTRDIPNFPTQGWADTAFYASNWNGTYVFYCTWPKFFWLLLHLFCFLLFFLADIVYSVKFVLTNTSSSVVVESAEENVTHFASLGAGRGGTVFVIDFWNQHQKRPFTPILCVCITTDINEPSVFRFVKFGEFDEKLPAHTKCLTGRKYH